ncbi:MAG: hypothetical protein HFG71_10705 [Hungatella sp.]|jgi:hypothetical protein|nr:hypothetical protein [Hungatella sp.]
MKSGGVWFFLSCKRYLRKVSFLLILLVLPAATFFVRGLEEKEGQEVRIAVCVETADSDGTDGKTALLEEELLEALTKQEGDEEDADGSGLFRFYECGSEEEVKAQVASRQAECGYVFSGNLRGKLDEGDYKRCIRVYSAPSTVLADLSTEVVFAALMKLYDREIFLDYVMEAQVLRDSGGESGWGGEAFDGGMEPGGAEGLETLAGELYDKWLASGSTFRFAYRYQNRGGQGLDSEGGTEAAGVFPVRGIVAVYLLLVGMYSAVMLGYDEEKGLFLPLSSGRRLVCRMAVLAAPVFLAALSALGALRTGGCFGDLAREFGVMGVYVLAVCGFSYGLKIICRRPQVVCCLIPLVLVGSLVFSPVFVDIRQFFPEWGWVEKAFLTSYYLRAF